MLKYLAKKETGFTLMELLIAVAIVVILAGVGIPVYLKFMASSKHAEASQNLAGIKLSEESYKLANGVYYTCAAAPRATLDQVAVPWSGDPWPTTTATVYATPTDFTTIDFTVGGNVLFVYEVVADTTTTFTAGALGDTNNDGTAVLFEASEDTSPTKVAAVGVAYTTIPCGLTIGDTD
jgi:prepilin-type N-terminal cleavage/methylation domain-containing protein